MKNFEQFVDNSLDILWVDLFRAAKVCVHADLAVAGPGVAESEFNVDRHKKLMKVKSLLDEAMITLKGSNAV